ncbi:MAG: hypothetical protein J5614_03395, partial [Paludibacteraceae bacterium]|nr:hypothetical protein [Paludibacteraceae bacterium]
MNIDERLDALELAVAELKKVATAYSIDKNNYITKMTQKTKAAVGTKVAYNSSGLVYKNEPLDESDIPQLSMDKITGLQKSLDNKAPSASIDAINTRIDELHKLGSVVATGSVVNIDKNGRVVSVEDLLPSNIPDLQIEKIIGLREELDQLRHPTIIPEQNLPDVTPSTGCKVTYDEHGHVLKSYPLSPSDIPQTVFERMDKLQREITDLANSLSTSISSLNTAVEQKADKFTSPVEPNTVYDAFKLDSEG